jgi:hypothetical protein
MVSRFIERFFLPVPARRPTKLQDGLGRTLEHHARTLFSFELNRHHLGGRVKGDFSLARQAFAKLSWNDSRLSRQGDERDLRGVTERFPRFGVSVGFLKLGVVAQHDGFEQLSKVTFVLDVQFAAVLEELADGLLACARNGQFALPG